MSQFGRGNFVVSTVLALTGLLTAGSLLVNGLSRFAGDLKPETANTYDVGTATATWRYGYFGTAVSSTTFIANPGSMAAPSFTFSGDTDTGIYRYGDNAMALTMGGGANYVFTSSLFTGAMGTFFSSAWYPPGNNATDLGLASNAFKDIYASGTIMAGGGVYATSSGGGFAGVSTVGYAFADNPDTGMGYNPAYARTMFYHNGTVILYYDNGDFTVKDNIYPGTGNTYDIGYSGTGAWRNIYASGTIYGVDANISGTIYQGTNLFTQNSVSTVFFQASYASVSVLQNTALPVATNSLDIGSPTLSWKNIYASGTEIVLGGLGANPVTDDFVCMSATGTLRHETANCTVSSARFKENIKSLSPDKMLEEVLKLRAVSFDWKEGYAPATGIAGGTKESTGFIAEEVALIDPLLVVYEETSDKAVIAWTDKEYPGAVLRKNGKTYVPKTVDYSRVSVIEAGAIRALVGKMTELQAPPLAKGGAGATPKQGLPSWLYWAGGGLIFLAALGWGRAWGRR